MKYVNISEELRNALIDAVMYDFDGKYVNFAKKIGMSAAAVGLWVNGKRTNMEGPTYDKVYPLIEKYINKEPNNFSVKSDFVCVVTGLKKCPFEGSGEETEALMKKIMKMSPVERAQLLTHVITKESEEIKAAG